jgi:hypothetical protein
MIFVNYGYANFSTISKKSIFRACSSGRIIYRKAIARSNRIGVICFTIYRALCFEFYGIFWYNPARPIVQGVGKKETKDD